MAKVLYVVDPRRFPGEYGKGLSIRLNNEFDRQAAESLGFEIRPWSSGDYPKFQKRFIVMSSLTFHEAVDLKLRIEKKAAELYQKLQKERPRPTIMEKNLNGQD